MTDAVSELPPAASPPPEDRRVAPPWAALGAGLLAGALAWTVGAWLQGRHLLTGLILTELLCFAAPAAAVLLWQRDAGKRGVFRPVPGGTLLLTTLIAGLVVTVAVAKGLAVRRALGVPPPTGMLPLPLWLIIAFVAPLCEELLFRPVLQDGLARVWRPGNAVLGTALLFGLVHGSASRFSETFLLGLFCGVVFLKTGSYWACVAFHVVANTLGPALYARTEAVPWLVHPVTSVAFVLATVWLCGRLGDPVAAEPGRRGWWARLREMLFGGGRLPPRHARGTPAFTAVYLGAALAAAGLVGLTLRGELRSRADAARVPVAREQDTWVLRADETIAAASRIEADAWPPASEPLLLSLPYPEARLVAIHQDGVELKWRMRSFVAFEVRQAPAENGAARGPLVVEWEAPLGVLSRDARGYRARLHALLPVTAYRLDLLLQPGGKWRFHADPGAFRATLFSLESTGGRPRLDFGSCGLGIREVVPPADATQ